MNDAGVARVCSIRGGLFHLYYLICIDIMEDEGEEYYTELLGSQ